MHNHGHHPRMNRRWPVVMADHFDCNLIEDGLPGRTACQLIATSPDAHLDGQLGLRIALNAHGPIDQLVIMLGTNDFQTARGHTAESALAGIAGLLAQASDAEMQDKHGGFGITLVAPPVMEEVGTFVPQLYGSAAKSRAFNTLLADLAKVWNLSFVDAAEIITVSPIDGAHFDEAAHDSLGRAIAAALHDVPSL